MKNSLLKKLGVGLAVTVFCGTSAFMAVAGNSIITGSGTVKTETLSEGVVYRQEIGAKTGAYSQNIYTVTYDYTDPNYDLVMGGKIGDRDTVSEMAKMLNEREGYTVLAGVNGDHFSFQTGIPMGFCMDDGEILESPADSKNATGYMFYSFGITRNGEVVTGYNPTLIATYQKAGSSIEDRISIERINRSRENFAASVLFTEAYGASTKTSGGLELVIKVKSGSVSPQANPLVGEVIAINESGNTPIEEGTVVLSGEGAAMTDMKNYQVGDEIEMNFSFVEEEWNYVDFAIGGHYSIVQNGEPMELDYTGDAAAAFGVAAPRTGVGMTKDGKLVIVATDGRGSAGGRGFTANEMAHYMAEDLNCENAILLDGGGSTEMVTMSGDTVNIRNTPSDGSERSVGNGLFLVKLDEPRAPETEPTAPTKAPVVEPVDLMPSDLNNAAGNNATAVYEDGALKVTATSAGATFTFPVNKEYNLNKLPNMFFTANSDVRFDIRVRYTGVTSGVVGIVSDYGPNFGSDVMSVGYLPAGVYDDKNENGADYEGVVNFAGGPNYNNNVPGDAMITIDSIEIRIQNPGTVRLDALYMSKLAFDQISSPSTTDSTDGTTASSNSSQMPPTDPSAAEPSVTETAGTTTAHTSPGTGYGMGALALAALLLAASASGVYFCRKTKAL